MSVDLGVPLHDRELELRLLCRGDRRAFTALRERNGAWLRPWDATLPGLGFSRPSFDATRRWMARGVRAGELVPLVIVVEGRLVGQITAGPLQYGAQSSAPIGYWVDREMAGRGIMPRALALLIDHCFAGIGLHRIEVNIRPENHASLRVAQKLHLRDEGLRERFIHVDGAWRDHRSFALTAEEVLGGPDGRGVLARLLAEPDPRARSTPPGTSGPDAVWDTFLPDLGAS